VGSRVRNDGFPLSRLPSELRIEKLVPGGDGYLRLADGRSVFVPAALPGDLVRPLEVADKTSYLRVLGFELRESGGERVKPICPIAEACGGCDWMVLAAAAQAKHKVLLVKEALERTGGIELREPPELVRAGASLGYRLRVRLHIDPSGRVGFFGRGTHELVPVSSCPVVAPALDAVIGALARLPAAERALLARFAEAELSASPSGGEVELELLAREGREGGAGDLDPLRSALPGSTRLRSSRTGGGSARRFELPGGAYLLVPSGAFTQVNWSVNEELVGHVVRGAKARGAEKFLDLYAGVGNFSVPLCRAGLRGVAVERDRSAARALRDALKQQALECEALSAEVRGSLERFVRAGRRFDLVLLDPPRVGAKDAVPSLISLAPTTIAYVACDPVTLARDLRALRSGGYALDGVVCFDMFPQTHHVETLVWLTRTSPSSDSLT
jgi:23S rRNA (uracil1939-C5)-methyltransferase